MAKQATQGFSLAAAFDEATLRLPGCDVAWLDALRAQAISSFRENGLPSRKVEAWRYTNLNALAKSGVVPGGDDVELPALPDGAALDIDEACRIVLVNGRMREDLSSLDRLPDGVSIEGLGDLLCRAPALAEDLVAPAPKGRDGALAALNDAFLEDGVVLRIDAGTIVDVPIHLVSVGVPVADRAIAFHPRHVIVTGAGSRATLVESHIGVGNGSYFSNGLTDITVGRAATFTHAKLQDEGAAAFHVALVRATIGDDAAYDSFVLHRGAELARHEIRAVIEGRGAECRLNGAYLGTGRQHLDNTTVIEHKAPGSRSSEVYKGVLGGHARGVFQGRIVVHRDAQQTDGHQLNKTLLLSREAEMDTKPELEIFADDVKCSHGATVGELSELEMFYLRTRGIDEEAARDMLVSAFLSEAVAELRDERLAEAFAGRVSGWVDAQRADRKEKAA